MKDEIAFATLLHSKSLWLQLLHTKTCLGHDVQHTHQFAFVIPGVFAILLRLTNDDGHTTRKHDEGTDCN